MPPRLPNPVWVKYFTGLWNWNVHRHRLIMWLAGSVVYAFVLWAAVNVRTGSLDDARKPLLTLCCAAAFFHLGCAFFGVWCWAKAELLAMLRVALGNMAFVFLFSLGCVALASPTFNFAAYLLAVLLIIRGTVLRSPAATMLAVFSLAVVLSRFLPPHQEAPVTYLSGAIVIATIYALTLGIQYGRAPPDVQDDAVAWTWGVWQVLAVAVLLTGSALYYAQHEEAYAYLAAALPALCPFVVFSSGQHIHNAVFLHCAAAAGALDALD